MGDFAMIATEKPRAARKIALSQAERAYLTAGLDQAGGKLPLFDKSGQAIKNTLIRSCVKKRIGRALVRQSAKT